MKMKEQDFEALKAAIEEVDQQCPSAREEYRNLGQPHMRYRWDMLRATRYPTNPLYEYLNDANIDTALRAILGSDYT